MKQVVGSKIGLVFALAEEEAGLRRVLAQSRAGRRDESGKITWRIGGLEIVVVVAGVGQKRSLSAARQVIASGVQLVVAAGFAAGLDPDVHVGDVVVASRVLAIEDGSQPIDCDARLIRSVPPSGKFGFIIRHGDLVTGDSVVCEAFEKARVFRRTGAAALDMESHAIGQECARAGVPFAAIRSVTDTADESLPETAAALAREPSTLRRAMVLASSPGSWLPIARLSSQARTAAANLGEILGLMLLRLV